MTCLRVLKCIEYYDISDYVCVWVKNFRDLVVIISTYENLEYPTILSYGDMLCDFIRFGVYGK